jgi:hypothetical protein
MAHSPSFWAIAMAGFFFAINLAQIGCYGLGWDEPATMERGRQTIALLKGGGFTKSVIEQDAASLALHNHPSTYATCNYVVSRLLTGYFDCPPVPSGHFLNLLVATTGLLIVFFFGRLLFCSSVGLIAEGFMLLFPRFTAHAHINPKDVPAMVFGSLALFLLTFAVRFGKTKYWALAGFVFALSVTSKLDGLFVLPIFMIAWLAEILGPTGRVHELKNAAWFIFVSVFFIYLLWTELWVDPLHIIRSLLDFTGEFRDEELTYLGHKYSMSGLPWHYIPLHLIAVTPLALLLFLVLGLVGSLRKLFQKPYAFEHWLLWSWIAIPVVPRMIPGIVRYDGMRQVFFVLPALALMAGFGANELIRFWHGQTAYRMLPLMGGGLVAWSIWQIIQCHPYEAFYLNEGVRAVVPGPKLARYFDFKGWGTVYTQGILWINQNAPRNSSFVLADHFRWENNCSAREDLRMLDALDVDKADFLVSGCLHEDLVSRFRPPPVYSIRCYNADLLVVYTHDQWKK